jgi:hypothetical protein
LWRVRSRCGVDRGGRAAPRAARDRVQRRRPDATDAGGASAANLAQPRRRCARTGAAGEGLPPQKRKCTPAHTVGTTGDGRARTAPHERAAAGLFSSACAASTRLTSAAKAGCVANTRIALGNPSRATQHPRRGGRSGWDARAAARFAAQHCAACAPPLARGTARSVSGVSAVSVTAAGERTQRTCERARALRPSAQLARVRTATGATRSRSTRPFA